MLDTFSRARRELTSCTQCGEPLVAPTGSGHVDEWCVRHLWECEACDYRFETAVNLRAPTT
jgi:hypothetical protein